MISRQAVLIDLAVLLREHTIDDVKTFGQGGGIARAIYEHSAELPFFVVLVIGNNTHVVAAVELGGIFLSIVELTEFSPGPRESVAQPAGESSFLFVQKNFRAVTPATAKNKFIFGIAERWRIAFFVFNLILHVFVINFQRSFV